jgi:hypothetical protein
MNTDEKGKEDQVITSERSSASEAISTPDRGLLRRDPEKNIGAGEHSPRNDTKKSAVRLWLARLLIAVVVAWNLECALVFLLNPGAYAPGFELAGIPGEAAIRGFAVLFVMWNIPYLVALWQPRRNRVSLWEALAMQVVGVIGESLILFSIPAGYPSLHASILRFIIFDASGVLLLSMAIFLSRK